MTDQPYHVYVIQGRGQHDYADCQAALARVPARMTALPFIGDENEVIARTRDVARDRLRIGEIVREWEATTVVVGLPLSLSGQVGPAARAALAEVDALRATLGIQVETYDERLSTVTAERSLMEQSLRAPARRRVVDKVAAAVMLQAWLDRGRSTS